MNEVMNEWMDGHASLLSISNITGDFCSSLLFEFLILSGSCNYILFHSVILLLSVVDLHVMDLCIYVFRSIVHTTCSVSWMKMWFSLILWNLNTSHRIMTRWVVSLSIVIPHREMHGWSWSKSCHMTYTKLSYWLMGQYFAALNNIALQNGPAPGQYFPSFSNIASGDSAHNGIATLHPLRLPCFFV